jgi:Xaa-Pro aminopeptidase
LLEGGARIDRASDPCMLPRACKNEVELNGARAAHLRDGVALSTFLAWLAAEAPKGTVTELSATDKLEQCRKGGNLYQGPSFATIAGAGSNGAIVHYRSSPATNRPLELGQIFLIDSGGQYLDGTTDVTRTVAVGEAGSEEKHRFTLVLKGHIALARARFPAGTSGSQLDSLARKPLWDHGLDYDHGTGHGVGSYLSVHEGPQRIAKIGSSVPLKPGMILSNEPGYYKTGAYGIRIENLVIVTKLSIDGAEREMLGFETLTLAPIDLNLVEPGLLTADERAWLNAYHARVNAEIGPKLTSAEEKAWLETATRPI